MNHVYYAKIDPLYQEDKYFNYYQNLPKGRQKRVDNYAYQEDKIRSVAAFTLLIKLLDDNKISYSPNDFKIDEYGKLYLDKVDIYLNLSHSGQYVIAAISDAPIGVDVERVDADKNVKEIIKYVLDIEETKEFNQSKDQIGFFYFTWSKKESYIKCVGKGLSMGMSTINLSKLKDYKFQCFKKENHQFAICYVAKPVINLQEIEL